MAKRSKKKEPKKKTKAQAAKQVSTPKPPPAPRVSFWKAQGLPALLLMLIGMGLYASTLQFGYVLDDSIVMEKNDFVKQGTAGIKKIMTTESFIGYFKEQKDLVEGGRYRPLSLVTFALENQLFADKIGQGAQASFKPNPKVSHFINILLYGLTALMLYRLLLLWLPAKEGQDWYWSIAFIAALLYVLHPIHTEVVANVKGRDEILMALCSLAALYACWKYYVKGSWAWLALSAGIYILALLAKENALTLVAIAPLAGYFFRKTRKDKLVISTLVFMIVAFGYLVLRSEVIGYFLSSGKEITDVMNNPFYNLGFAEKYATVFYTLGLYLKLLVFPHPLTHDYYPYHIPVMSWGDWQVILSFLANLALGLAALWGLRKKKIWSFAILFYFITLSIVSNIPFTVGTFMNERFVYFPSIGACLLLAWIGVEYLPRRFAGLGKQLGMGLIGLLAIGFIIKTLERVPAWESALTLNSAAIKISKNSARANLFYGTALFEEYKVEQDREKKYALLDKLTPHINRAVEINPDYYSAWTMMAGVAAEQHKRDSDLTALLNGFYEVLDHRPNIDYIHQYLDYIKERNSPSMIMKFAIRSGRMLAGKGDYNNAMRMYNHGLSLDSSHPELRQAVGELYQAMGNRAKAAEYLQ